MTSARIDPTQDLWVVVNDLGRLSLAGACHAYDDRLPIHVPMFMHEHQAVKFAEQMNEMNRPRTVGAPEFGAPYEMTEGTRYFVKKVVPPEVLSAADVVC